jgi:hypothetical protein
VLFVKGELGLSEKIEKAFVLCEARRGVVIVKEAFFGERI